MWCAASRTSSASVRRTRSARDALEGMLADGNAREEAARALIPAYEATKDHRKLVAALDVLAEVARDDAARVLALRQAAQVHLTQLRQPELAFASLARALRLTPGDMPLRAAARQAAEDADSLDAYAEILIELTEEGDTGAARAGLLRELAEVQEKKLDDRNAAVSSLRSLLALEPGNLDCLRALQRLHRAGEEWAALAEVLEKLAAAAPEPAEQLAYLREAALLHESKLSDKESAADAWRAIAEARSAPARGHRLPGSPLRRAWPSEGPGVGARPAAYAGGPEPAGPRGLVPPRRAAAHPAR